MLAVFISAFVITAIVIACFLCVMLFDFIHKGGASSKCMRIALSLIQISLTLSFVYSFLACSLEKSPTAKETLIKFGLLKATANSYAWNHPTLPAPATCSQCGDYQIDFSYHLKRENRCYVRFDHYCIWLNTAVAKHNHRLFCCMLINGIIATSYTAAVLIYFLARHRLLRNEIMVVLKDDKMVEVENPKLALIICCFATILLAITIGVGKVVLLVISLLNLSRDVSMYFSSSATKAASLGTLKHMLGDSVLLWPVPFSNETFFWLYPHLQQYTGLYFNNAEFLYRPCK